VPRFKERTLTEPVHILISYDEEVGCTGVRPLIARLGRDLPHPRAIIVGEPTNMEVIDAHKRIDAYDTTVTGKEAHSGMPGRGVNAIAYAAELVLELERIGADLAAKESDPRFDPPYSTVQVGVIQGGTAGNIVPKTCRLQWQVRSLPSVEAGGPARRLAHFAKDSLLPRMHRAAREAAIETVHGNSVPAFQAAADSTAVGLALELAGREHTCAVSYTTEAGLFEKAGVPSVVCGPGSAEQAHAADEFVTEAQLKACMTFLDRLAAHCGA
jgi:acetylornithine deacetylase